MAMILIVDDDPALTRLLALWLENEGYETATANSGPDALEIARRDRPDAILLDLMMPMVSGLAVCRELKGDERTCAIPVVIISGDGHADKKTELVGANACIVKPFDLDEVVATVRKFCP
ncbi:MAG: response regulator [Chloroflexi bacterium]|nr:response regulator [Chloroflexota bacterium]